MRENALGPKRGKKLMHFRTRGCEHHQRLIGRVAKSGIDELHGGEIAPLQILEHENDGLRGALGSDEILERQAHLIAHEHGILQRGLQLQVLLVARADAEELAEKCGDALEIFSGERSRQTRAKLCSANDRRLAFQNADASSKRLRKHSKRRADAHRIAAADPNFDRTFGANALDELVTNARFSDAFAAFDEHGLSNAFVRALIEDRLERSDFARAADARCWFAEERAAALHGIARAVKMSREAGAGDFVAAVEEAGCELVDVDRRDFRSVARACGLFGERQQTRGAIDHFADGHATRVLAAARCERHCDVWCDRAHRQNTSRGARRLIGRDADAFERHDERPIGDHFEPSAVSARGVGKRVERCRYVRGGDRHAEWTNASLRREQARDHDAKHSLLAAGDSLLRRNSAHSRLRRRARLARLSVDFAERRRDGRAVRGALRGIFREHAREKMLERSRHFTSQRANERRIFEHDFDLQRDDVVADEQRSSDETLEEHASERKNIGARVDIERAARLLRRHVSGRADDDAHLRFECNGTRCANNSEIEELYFVDVAVREKNIARFEIAMNEAVRVRDGERLRETQTEKHRVGDVERAALEAIGEIFAGEPFHCEVELAGLRVSVRDVADDCGMPQLGEDARFARETLSIIGVGARGFERDGRAGEPILRAINVAHSAGTHENFDLETIRDEGARLHASRAYANASTIASMAYPSTPYVLDPNLPIAKQWDKPLSGVAALSPLDLCDEEKERHRIYALLLFVLMRRYFNGNKNGSQGEYPWREKQRDPDGRYQGGDYLGHNIGALAVDGNGEVIDFDFNHNQILASSAEHAETRLVRRVFSLTQIYDNWATRTTPDRVQGYSTILSNVTVYTSLESCAQCSGVMALGEVQNVVFLQRDPGTYHIGNILYSLTNSGDKSIAPRPIPGDNIDFSYFDELNTGYADYYGQVKDKPFWKPSDGGKPDASRALTGFL